MRTTTAMSFFARPPYSTKHSREAGVTLVEVLCALALSGLITVIAVSTIQNWSRGVSAVDARLALIGISQSALTAADQGLQDCQRLFDRTSVGTGYLARVDFTGSPTLLSGSQLPRIEAIGALTPGSTSFVSTSVGNTLFFAATSDAEDLALTDSSSQTQSYRIDTFRFHLFYLAADASASLGGKPRRVLYHWISKRYADWGQLQRITDSAAVTGAMTALRNDNVFYSWDSTSDDVNAAFFNLQPTAVVADATHSIQRDQLVNLIAPRLRATVIVGVSPNTSANYSIPQTVPAYAPTGSVDFPSGLETVIAGSGNDRKMLARLVLAAPNSIGKHVSYEAVTVSSLANSW
jgi:prepilin-type N-terminal cleavage/methylation domain-containing protein